MSRRKYVIRVLKRVADRYLIRITINSAPIVTDIPENEVGGLGAMSDGLGLDWKEDGASGL